MCYRNPKSNEYGNKDKKYGKLTIPLKEYRRNLNSIVKILKKSGAKLIFVSTTYVPENEPGRFVNDAVAYNRIALEVMKENSVTVNDIYAKSIKIHQQFAKAPNDVHYTNEGYNELGELILSFLKGEIKAIVDKENSVLQK